MPPDPGERERIPDPVTSPEPAALSYDAMERLERIGAGGNADVYRVRTGSGTLALKEPRFQGTMHAETVDRFRREAETWATLDDHEGIVGVVDWGTEPLPWIALEYMDAGNLGARFEDPDRGRSVAESLWIAGRVARAVRYAHRHGVAHLDLKPSNVLFRETPAGRWPYPKVGDWGLATFLIDHSGSVEGLSPRYAAPEQFDPDTYGSPDDFTDLYQLGAVTYELLTGRPPFTGPRAAVMHSVLEDDPLPPSERNPDLPQGIDEVVTTALAKRKADRQETVVDFRRGIDAAFERAVDPGDLGAEKATGAGNATADELQGESPPGAVDDAGDDADTVDGDADAGGREWNDGGDASTGAGIERPDAAPAPTTSPGGGVTPRRSLLKVAAAIGIPLTAVAGTALAALLDVPVDLPDLPPGGGGGSGFPETHSVELTDGLEFQPEAVTVAPGDAVAWENVGSIGHSVTAYGDGIPDRAEYFASGDFDSEAAARAGFPDRGEVAGGETYERTFETPGTYEYFCIPHESAGMTGRVRVDGDGTPPGTGTGAPYGGWLEDVDNFDGVVDWRGREAVTVEVGVEQGGGPYGFGPPAVRLDPGTTVFFVWASDTHNLAIEDQPPGGEWEGHDPIEGADFTHETTLETTGVYKYFCEPHFSLGMKGVLDLR